MNRNHVALFHAVAESGSISGGAERLRISQPAVSSQLAELEAALGVRLFDRLPRGVRLTEAGLLLSQYAHRMAALENDAGHVMAEFLGLKRGRLAIGASTTIGSYLIPEILAAFHEEYPDIELRLEIANTEGIQRILGDGDIELALTEGLIENESLDSEVFHEDELVPIVRARHPLIRTGATLRQLHEEPWILREPGSGTRAVIERHLKRFHLTVKPVISIAGTEAIKRAVMAGMGIAVVSRLSVESELRAKTLAVLPIPELVIPRPLHLQTRKGHHPGPAAGAFINRLNSDLGKRSEMSGTA
jgi:DNA-binding transcriptional LysR family regulator